VTLHNKKPTKQISLLSHQKVICSNSDTAKTSLTGHPLLGKSYRKDIKLVVNF
jgi:hypothetical protein